MQAEERRWTLWRYVKSTGVIGPWTIGEPPTSPFAAGWSIEVHEVVPASSLEAADLRVELQLAEDARKRAESRCKRLEEKEKAEREAVDGLERWLERQIKSTQRQREHEPRSKYLSGVEAAYEYVLQRVRASEACERRLP